MVIELNIFEDTSDQLDLSDQNLIDNQSILIQIAVSCLMGSKVVKQLSEKNSF